MGMIYKNGVPYFGGGGGGTGNVDSVNGISPDVNKNVQVDVELTQAEYDALPSSKLTDDVNYWITDGNNNPLNNNVMATGVVYDNTDSGLTATNAQDAIDENASEIADVKTNLTAVETAVTPINLNLTSTYTLNNQSFRMGKLIVISFKASGITASSNVELATIQSGYAPSAETPIIAGTNNGTVATGWIRNTGVIVFVPSQSVTNIEARIFAVYHI